MHWDASKTVPFFKTDFSLPQYVGCRPYAPFMHSNKGYLVLERSFPIWPCFSTCLTVFCSTPLSATSQSKLHCRKTGDCSSPGNYKVPAPCSHTNLWQTRQPDRQLVKRLQQNLGYDCRQPLLPDTYCFNINREDESLKQPWASVSKYWDRHLSLRWQHMLQQLWEHCPSCPLHPQHASQTLKSHPCCRLAWRRNFALSFSSSI